MQKRQHNNNNNKGASDRNKSSTHNNKKDKQNPLPSAQENKKSIQEELEVAPHSNFVAKNFGVRYFDLHARPESIYEVVAQSKLKARYNQIAKNYVQLIEHLELPHATTCLTLTKDENHLFASGIYPPQIKCYELDQLSVKFERHVDSEVLRMIVRWSV